MRNLLSVLGLCLLAASPATAGPPDEGYVGPLIYSNGREPDRFACDTLALVRTIYAAGRDSIFSMHPKFKELAVTKGAYGDPQCTVGAYNQVKVVEPAVLLGPVENPVGDAELFFWAIHVDNSPRGGKADYWILYLDTKTARPWLQVGTAI